MTYYDLYKILLELGALEGIVDWRPCSIPYAIQVWYDDHSTNIVKLDFYFVNKEYAHD